MRGAFLFCLLLSLFCPTPSQRYLELERLLIGRAYGPLQSARDYRRLHLFACERFEGADIFFSPHPELRSRLRHLCSPCPNCRPEIVAFARPVSTRVTL